MSSVGLVVTVPEDLQDAVTAVSGSGPAYLFYLAEAMTAAGVETELFGEVETWLYMLGSIDLGQSQLVHEKEGVEVTHPASCQNHAFHYLLPS